MGPLCSREPTVQRRKSGDHGVALKSPTTAIGAELSCASSVKCWNCAVRSKAQVRFMGGRRWTAITRSDPSGLTTSASTAGVLLPNAIVWALANGQRLYNASPKLSSRGSKKWYGN